MTNLSRFRQENKFEERIKLASRMKQKYPDRIPVIVEAVNAQTPQIKKNKFLVPKDVSVGKLIYEIRRYTQVSAEEALFVFVNNTLISTSSLIEQVYEKHKDVDQFMYLVYSLENTFG
jgi:GABA(A) receptor-associated protein